MPPRTVPSASRLARSWPETSRSTCAKRRPHAAGERLVVRMSLQRVDPDDRERLAREPRHLATRRARDRRARTRRRGSRRPRRGSARDGPTRRCRPSATRRSACRPTSRRRASAAAASAASGSRDAELARQPREPRAERERLDAAPGAARRVQVEQQRPGVRLHRAGDVEQQDELARRLRRGCGRRARPDRRRSRATRARARARRAPTRGGRGAGDACAAAGRATAICRISTRARANSSGVIAAKSCVRSSSSRAPGADLELAAVELRARARARRPCAAARRVAAAPPRAAAGGTARAQEPGVERAVERLEVLAPRDERLAKRPVDVLLPAEVDRVEPAQRVGDPAAARPRGRPRAARGRRRRRAGRPRATARSASSVTDAATSPASASSRIESRSSWYLSSEPSVAWTFSTSSSCWPSAVSACTQSIVSATPGGFCRSSDRSSAAKRAASCGEPLRHAGHAQLARSRSRARPTGGRSSGRGSGA